MKEQNNKQANYSVEPNPPAPQPQDVAAPDVQPPASEQEKPQKKKGYSRFRLEADELSKIAACCFAVVILYLFFRSTVDFGNFRESLQPELLVLYALKQLLNIIFGYLITLVLRIKNEKVQFVLTFVFAFIVDNLLVFKSTDFQFTPLNIALLAFIAVIFTVFIIKTLFHSRILNKISKIEDEQKRAKSKKTYWIFYWILFALTFAAMIAYTVLALKTGIYS